MEITPWMVIGFLLAAYSVTANDSLQTLGSYLSSNEHRTPKWVQMVFLCTLTASVLIVGWFINDGEPAWGRLTAFPQPDCFTWAYLIPPIAVLALTVWGAPVSTSFLVLSAFVPGNIGTLVEQSVSGYLLALSLGLAVWGLGLTLLERLFEPNHRAGSEFNRLWYGLQWCSTGSLWSLWLVQDLANIFIFFAAQHRLYSDAALHHCAVFRTVRLGGHWRGTDPGGIALKNRCIGPALSHRDRSDVCDLSPDADTAQQLPPQYNLGFSRTPRRP